MSESNRASLLPLASTTWSDEEIDEAIKVLKSGRLTMGEQVQEFECEFAAYIETKYAVMFNSGSSANLAMLSAIRLMGFGEGKKNANIIVPAVSWSTTFYPVNQAGYRLKFVDIDIDTLNLDVGRVREAIDEDTIGIFAVNLLGNPDGIPELRQIADEFGLVLLEDNCEALGAKIDEKFTGSFGLGGSHSFYFSHHMCTMEGGMVTTNDLQFYELMKSIRAHGWTRELPRENTVFPKTGSSWDDLFRFVVPGYNLRPMEISGAIGRIQLKKLPDFLEVRRNNAETFKECFHSNSEIIIQKGKGSSSWFGFSIILNPRDEKIRSKVIVALTENGVDTRPIVAGNFTRNPVMRHLDYLALPVLGNADVVHDFGFFVGNHHVDIRKEISQLRVLLEEVMRKL